MATNRADHVGGLAGQVGTGLSPTIARLELLQEIREAEPAPFLPLPPGPRPGSIRQAIHATGLGTSAFQSTRPPTGDHR